MSALSRPVRRFKMTDQNHTAFTEAKRLIELFGFVQERLLDLRHSANTTDEKDKIAGELLDLIANQLKTK